MKKFILLVIMLGLFVDSFAFDMVVKGKPNATVILEKNPTESDKYACENFIKYIKLISGAELTTSDTPTEGNNIFIGRGENVQSVLSKIDYDSLKKDGIYIYCKGKNLVLTGDEGQGVIYAVFSFLEEYLGVKYILPDQDLIVKKSNIILNDINYKYVPIFYSRCSFQGPGYNGGNDYKIKHKINGRFDNIPKEIGGTVEINGGAHTFLIYMNPKDYGQEHPEWFAFRDGKRNLSPETQLCLSNEEMVKELTKNVLKRIEEYPQDTIFSVSQFDNRNYCECEKCKALTEKYGHSGALLTVVNKVAEEVEAKYPDKYIQTLAYQYTQHLPTNIVPRDNVIVELCSIECDFSKTFDDPKSEENKAFMTDLLGWKKLTKQLSIWDYTADFTNFLYPFPNFQVLQKNVQILAENNAKLVFEEGDYKNSNAFLLPYKAYINAKLLWDPNIDMDKESKIFLKEYYGPAWKDMYDLVKYTEKVMSVSEEKLPENRADCGFFTAQDWIKGFKFLNSAIGKVKNNEKYYERVWTDLLCWNYSVLVSSKSVLEEVKDANVMTFTNKKLISDEITKWGHGLNYYSEAVMLKDSPLKPIDLTKSPNKPEICKDLSDDQWVEWTPEDLENFFKREDVSKIVEDPKASSGKARWVSSQFKDWWTQEPLEILKNFDEYTTGEVYVTYRVDKGESPANSYVMGFYSNKKDTKIYVNNTDTPTGEYITVKIGEIDLENMNVDAYFYVCGNQDALNTSPGLYIDRLFVVLK